MLISKTGFRGMPLVVPLTLAALWFTGSATAAPLFEAGLPDGWTCQGACGTSGANGDVGLAPGGGSQYGWVSTAGGIDSVELPGVTPDTPSGSGSRLTSTAFSAAAGQVVNFQFNYVTTDTNVFVNPPPVTDYAWARLLGSDSSAVGFLFTARTTPDGNTVPGFGLPLPDSTLTPSTAPIIARAPTWEPLGDSSGECAMGPGGCGYTGWIQSSFSIAATGEYRLEFGVTNVLDDVLDSGLAFDGMTIGEPDVEPPTEPPTASVPEPWSITLLVAGLAGVCGCSRRRQRG